MVSSYHPTLRLMPGIRDRTGFSLIEFMVSSLILLLIAGTAFEILSRAQRTAACQADMQEIMDNTRIAMDTVARYLRQAANDPLGAGFDGITIVSASEVRVRSDLTGSAGRSNPDKGDPDGDVDDASEDVRIRYNDSNRTIEVIPAGGSAQAIASNISAFSMQYLNSDGAETSAGSDIRRIRVTFATTGSLPDPRTKQYLSIRLTSDVRLATRR
jgi:prepilin-type N-terminal cleavage/methylation domain-containing protein